MQHCARFIKLWDTSEISEVTVVSFSMFCCSSFTVWELFEESWVFKHRGNTSLGTFYFLKTLRLLFWDLAFTCLLSLTFWMNFPSRYLLFLIFYFFLFSRFLIYTAVFYSSLTTSGWCIHPDSFSISNAIFIPHFYLFILVSAACP